jgi:hypothetical protein
MKIANKKQKPYDGRTEKLKKKVMFDWNSFPFYFGLFGILIGFCNVIVSTSHASKYSSGTVLSLILIGFQWGIFQFQEWCTLCVYLFCFLTCCVLTCMLIESYVEEDLSLFSVFLFFLQTFVTLFDFLLYIETNEWMDFNSDQNYQASPPARKEDIF